jgi:hypothetical protein
MIATDNACTEPRGLSSQVSHYFTSLFCPHDLVIYLLIVMECHGYIRVIVAIHSSFYDFLSNF